MDRARASPEPLERVRSAIARGKIPAIVVTRFDPARGEDLLGRDRLVKDLRQAVLGDPHTLFGETTFETPVVDLLDVIAAAREISLLTQKRLVLVSGSRISGGSPVGEEGAPWGEHDGSEGAGGSETTEEDRTSPRKGGAERKAPGRGRERAGGGGEAQDEDAARLAVFGRYLEKAARSACIVFSGCAWDGRRRLHKAVLDAATVVDVSRPDPREVPAWIESFVGQAGSRIEPEASAVLAELRGNDTMRLANEIEKLLLHAGEARPISREDVSALVGDGEATSAWALGEALADGDAGRGVQALRRLFAEAGVAPVIVGAVASRLRQLIVLRDEKTVGRANEPARRVVFPGRSVYFADALARKATRFSEKVLARALASLYEVDKRSKSSAVEPEALLEEWLQSTLKSIDSVRSS